MDEGLSGFCIKASSNGNNVRGCGGGGHSHTSATTAAAAAAGTKCGRWNPTAEQVKVLTDLFRAGLRTPSTDQIQKISAQLSFYGKIESKNVFYWFQNHKARERQKRRKVSVRDDFQKSSILRRDDKFSSSASKRFDEINQDGEHERVIETLQLFPLNPFEESESEKRRILHANDYCKDAAFSYTFGTDMNHPPLELRLSFM